MSEYEDWNGSRWEYTTSKSSWHFDNTRAPQLGKDSYTPVCIFDTDFTDAISECMPRTQVSTWGTRNNFNKTIAEQGLYTANAEEQDLINAGASPHAEVFSRTAAEDIAVFHQIADYLGLEDPMIKFHNQTTGQMLHFHIDNFAARPERENSFKVTDMDKNPAIMRRFAVMLADWEMGQAWMFGNALYHQWTAGTCITWEWQDMPHATVNAGWKSRPLLQITGKQTARTLEIVAAAQAAVHLPMRVVKL